MKRVHQLISCYLTLCVALAGTVGISPRLHQWVEHAGQGPAHVHFHVHGPTSAGAPVHSHSHVPGHDFADGQRLSSFDGAAQPRQTGLFVSTHESFTLPTIHLTRLWHAFTRLVAGDAPSESTPSPEPSEDGHHHDSLVQLLLNGLVHCALNAPPSAASSHSLGFEILPPQIVLLASGWDAQTASRGPPLLWS